MPDKKPLRPSSPVRSRRAAPRPGSSKIARESRQKAARPPRVAAPSHVQDALDAFRHIVQALRVARAGELSSAGLFALQQIADHPDASVNDIAALTFTHQSSVSVVIQRLVSLRLVAKIPSTEDRRRQRLALTGKGRRALSGAPAAVQGHLIAAIAALPATDRQVLARSLATIARLISPDNKVPHPPMFFEGAAAR